MTSAGKPFNALKRDTRSALLSSELILSTSHPPRDDRENEV